MFIDYYGLKLHGPPWPTTLSPRSVVVLTLADGSAIFADPSALFFTRNRWKSKDDLLGEFLLVNTLQTLLVLSSHLTEGGGLPVSYIRPMDKYVKVVDILVPPFPVAPLGWYASPADGGPSPWDSSYPGIPDGDTFTHLHDPQPPGADCLCVLTDVNCGTRLILPVGVSFS
jgi:hypothetical protein